MPLRIGIAAGVATSSLAPVLRELNRRMPRLTLTVRHGGSSQINDWLLASEIDVGLTADGERLTERAIQWPLFDDSIVVLVSQDHQLAGDGPLETERIGGHLVLRRIGGDGPLDGVFSRLAGGCKTPAARHFGATEEHINEMVAAGLGVGLSTERQPMREGVLRRPIWPPQWLTVCLAMIPGRPCSSAAHTFIRLARDRTDWYGGVVQRKAVLTMAVDNTGPPVEGVGLTKGEERNGRTACARHIALSAADRAG
jgi:DNA-binding transcriptional LysR family regulator